MTQYDSDQIETGEPYYDYQHNRVIEPKVVLATEVYFVEVENFEGHVENGARFRLARNDVRNLLATGDLEQIDGDDLRLEDVGPRSARGGA